MSDRIRERLYKRERDQEYGKKPLLRKRKLRNLPHCCKPGTMHTCKAQDSPDRQKDCSFHIPSSSNHCMELRFDEYCSNHTLHQYIRGGISDSLAKARVSKEKDRLAIIQNRVGGYHIDFPLDGEETMENLQHIYNQLQDLGMTHPSFWLDKKGRSADEYDSFSISGDDIKNGIWTPKRKELKKDILKYLQLKDKLTS